MDKFTVQIDLSAYFEDERKNILMYVDPGKMTTVAGLQGRVQRMFGLENVGFLCKKTGCFISPAENIEMLQLVQVLQAFTSTRSDDVSVLGAKPKKSKKSKLAEVVSEEPPPTPAAVELLPVPTPRSVSKTQEHQKKRKYVDEDNNNNSKSNEISSTSEQQTGTIAAVAAPQKSKKPKIRATDEDLKAAADEEVAKVKRKRTRRAKNQKSPPEDIENLSMEKSANLTTTQQGDVTNGRNESNSHIFYNTTGELVNATSTTANITTSNNNTITHSEQQDQQESPAKAAAKVIFRCELNKLNYNKPRNFALNHVKCNSSNSSQKSPIIIQEHIVIKPPVDAEASAVDVTPQKQHTATKEKISSVCSNSVDEDASSLDCLIVQEGETAAAAPPPVPEISTTVVDVELEKGDGEVEEEDEKEQTVFDDSEVCLIDISDTETVDDQLDETAVKYLEETTTKDQSLTEEITIEKIMPFSVPLDKLPNIGDIVLFKMYRLDNGEPKISNFIAGKCEYINKRTKMIKLNIIDGQKELGHLPSKFSCNLDDSTVENSHINMKLSEMLEARVFPMS